MNMKNGKQAGNIAVLAALMACAWSGALFAADINNGKRLYASYCASCHGAGGISVMPGAPNFQRGERLMQPDMALHAHMQNGKNACPSFRGMLSDREIMDVVAHLRTMN
jgi:cytochrome c6